MYTKQDYKSLGFSNVTTGFPNTTQYVQDFFERYDGSRTGSSVPGFRKKIEAGVSATSAYTSDRFRINKFEPGDCQAEYGVKDAYGPGKDGTISDSGVGFCFAPYPRAGFIVDPVNLSAIEAMALEKIYERIKAVRSQMNGLQFLGELRESIHMIRHPANALLKGLRSYHDIVKSRCYRVTRNVPRAQRAAIIKDTVSGLWLEYSYGWKPLFNDMKEIGETVGRAVAEKQQTRERVSAAASETPEGLTSYQSSSTGYYGYLAYDLVTKRYTTVGIRWNVGLSSDVIAPTDSLARIAQLSGFTLENFVPTVWELIPLSFLLEYFSNIGTMIEASCMSTAGITWLSKTVRTEVNVHRQAGIGTQGPVYLPMYPRGIKSSRGHYGKINISRILIERTVPQNLALPDLVLTYPGKANKYVNMMALLAQSFRTTSRGLARSS